jgi:hypothetical protein
MAMKQTSKMVMVAAALLVGVSGNAWDWGPSDFNKVFYLCHIIYSANK